MADAVALTSVITSGAVALAGILVGAQAARNQRRHEKELAFEERVWETKSDAMFRLITAVQDFRRVLRAEDPHKILAVQMPDTIDNLHAIAPAIEAYCTENCRVTFIAFHTLLSDAQHNLELDKAQRLADAALAAARQNLQGR